MSEVKKTHRLVKNPQISSRFLAEYMAASEMARRTILTNCKYQPIVKLVQHDAAKLAISKYLRSENPLISELTEESTRLRGLMADSEFDRDVNDHNADYIDQFTSIVGNLEMPKGAEILAPGQIGKFELNGVKIATDIQLRLHQLTKTNKTKVGAAVFRYSKGKALKVDVANWQSAFIMGFLSESELAEDNIPEKKLCLTLDLFSGIAHPAPTDSLTKFKNIRAACVTIVERWENIKAPANAVL